jgi:hypothetical protein
MRLARCGFEGAVVQFVRRFPIVEIYQRDYLIRAALRIGHPLRELGIRGDGLDAIPRQRGGTRPRQCICYAWFSLPTMEPSRVG